MHGSVQYGYRRTMISLQSGRDNFRLVYKISHQTWFFVYCLLKIASKINRPKL